MDRRNVDDLPAADVAIVGAKLYYPDNLIQHAGVVLGMGGIAGHIMCHGIMRRQRIFRQSRKCTGNQCRNCGMHAYESQKISKLWVVLTKSLWLHLTTLIFA